MIDSVFKTWETNRKIYLEFLNKYSLAQLNKIPSGFNNNLIWNVGHIIVSQQTLVYRLSNLPMYISDEQLDLYKNGTKPTGNTTQQEVDELKVLLLSNIEKTKADFANQKFVTFTERLTLTGFLLSNLNDALEFNNYHEGMHLGMMMSLRKFV